MDTRTEIVQREWRLLHKRREWARKGDVVDQIILACQWSLDNRHLHLWSWRLILRRRSAPWKMSWKFYWRMYLWHRLFSCTQKCNSLEKFHRRLTYWKNPRYFPRLVNGPGLWAWQHMARRWCQNLRCYPKYCTYCGLLPLRSLLWISEDSRSQQPQL